jgi:hypothetical protein
MIKQTSSRQVGGGQIERLYICFKPPFLTFLYAKGTKNVAALKNTYRQFSKQSTALPR